MTWCSGTAGCTGAVSASNSLVGSTANDSVGASNGTALPNGNYVVLSPNWDNGAATDAGAVTWCSGTAGCTGAVSASNSLVGSTANDQVGFDYGYHRADATATMWCTVLLGQRRGDRCRRGDVVQRDDGLHGRGLGQPTAWSAARATTSRLRT